MAESSLSVGYADLCAEVGFFLGYGRTSANWSVAQSTLIDKLVQSGVRRVYYPPAIDGQLVAQDWSWLHPTSTLSLTADDGDYDLPDDFGRLIGNIHYEPDEQRASIAVVSVGDLLEMRAHSDKEGAPTYVAVRYKSSDRTTGQRQEALFWPEPDASYTVYYEYEAYSGALSDTYPYPLGGMQLAELYIESCLAVAEQRVNDAPGVHSAAFQSLLIDALLRDRKRGARNFGHMGHCENYIERIRHGDTGSSYPIVYKGETY